MTRRRCQTGTLELGGGLEVLVSASLATLPPGETLDVVAESRASAFELPAWARKAGHEIVDESREGDSFVITLRRGMHTGVLADRAPGGGGRPNLADGKYPTAALRRVAGEATSEADPAAGLVPLGAVLEASAATYDWTLSSRDRVWTEKLAGLADRAAQAQWNATTDIPWEAAGGLKPDVERAVARRRRGEACSHDRVGCPRSESREWTQ
jgi:TusA-related sulfurtransferase